MDAIYKISALVVLISMFVVEFGDANGDNPFCSCEDEGYWTGSRIVEYQKVSDFLIAVAYFSIPIEILYFVSCSNVPFKWVLLQFMAFIVLCGLTHLLSGWTYGQHPFYLMLALTIFKFLTALVSFATSITLVTLIPMLLKVKVRELMLKKKARDLGQEVYLIKKKKEASLHVRMLTHEIRKSLDRHTILYTTLDKLSEVLDLYSCAVWTPNEARTEVCLTHVLNGRHGSSSIPTSDPDVRKVKGTEEVQILHARSVLSLSSGSNGAGEVAAVRMPMLRVCDFNSGGQEVMQECFAILVCILPGREWAGEELEILRAVADQVAVALSHAAVLEESQLMRDKLADQNLDLQRAQQDTLMASYARNAFQVAMADGLRRPMHSIIGLVSMMQDDNMNIHKKLLIDSIAKTSTVLSVLINDVMESSDFSLVKKTFCLRSMIKEAACVSRCLCIDRGYGFGVDIDKKLPKFIVGDERRILQVILHMVGNLLDRGSFMMLKVTLVDTGNKRPGVMDGFVYVMFEVGTNGSGPRTSSSSSVWDRRHFNSRSTQMQEELSFSMCRKTVEMMQGNIWVVPNPEGFEQSMALALKVQVRPSISVPTLSEPYPHPVFHGLNVLLADHDTGNRAVTRKLLERLGCNVMPVASGVECLDAIGPHTTFEVVLLDLGLPDIDGFEVALRIRKFSSSSLPLIVALTTSNGGDDVWIKCLEIGMSGVIRKPINLKGISVELGRALSVANIM